MKPSTVIALAACGGLVAIGAVLNDGTPSSHAYSTPPVVLGCAGAAVFIALWSARAMGFGKKGSAGAGASGRIETLVGQLVRVAQQAEERGVLTLSECRIDDRAGLFSRGLEMIVAAEPATLLRQKLVGHADEASSAAHVMRTRMALVCKFMPVVALSMALTTMVWVLATIGLSRQIEPMAPLGLLVAVYGCFAVAALSVEAGQRIASSSATDEMANALVIETLVAIRNGEPAAQIEGRLKAMLTPGGSSAAQPALRKAA